MDPKKNLKLCPYCDGQVDYDVIVCPYCGSDISSTNEAVSSYYQQDESFQSMSAKDTLASLYPPPYQPKVFNHSNEEEYPDPFEEKEEKPVEEKTEGINFLSIFLLSLGVTCLGFSLLLFFFSKNGELVLRFNGHLWILFLLLAIPMLYGGYRFFSNKQISE